jgi:hypothetical protein
LEELCSSAAAPALDRGWYNCLTFEGPGQGGVIRKQKIPFRYDWEKVVSPVIDYAIKRNSKWNIAFYNNKCIKFILENIC